MRCTALTRRCGCGLLYVRELSAGAAFVPAGFSPGTGDCARGGTDGGTVGRCGIVALARGWPCGSGGALCLGARLASRFCCGFALAHGWYRVPVAALCLGARLALRFWRGAFPRFTFGGAFLARRFVLARGWPCGSGGALILGSRPASRSCRGVALGSRPASRFCCGFALARGWPCGSGGALILGSRLLFVLRQTGRLAISCVPIPPGRDRHSRVLAVSVRLSALAGSLRVWPFLYGDPDG